MTDTVSPANQGSNIASASSGTSASSAASRTRSASGPSSSKRSRPSGSTARASVTAAIDASSAAALSISRQTRPAPSRASASASPIVKPPSGRRCTEPNSHTVLSPPVTSQRAGSALAGPAASAATATAARPTLRRLRIPVHPFDAGIDAAGRIELDPAVRGRAAVDLELIGILRELHARRGRAHQADAPAHALEGLVGMPPGESAHVVVAREYGEEILRVVEHQFVEPGASVGHRVVVQADERVCVRLCRQRDVEAGKLLVVEMAAVLAGDRAVEHDEQPGAVTPGEVVHERRPVEFAADVLRIVVIARQAVDRRAGVAELRPEQRVPGRVVVHEVTG